MLTLKFERQSFSILGANVRNANKKVIVISNAKTEDFVANGVAFFVEICKRDA